MEGLVKAWHEVIEPIELEKLVAPMPNRCRFSIENKGWPIKY